MAARTKPPTSTAATTTFPVVEACCPIFFAMASMGWAMPRPTRYPTTVTSASGPRFSSHRAFVWKELGVPRRCSATVRPALSNMDEAWLMRMAVAVSSRATVKVMTTPLARSHLALSAKVRMRALTLLFISKGIDPR